MPNRSELSETYDRLMGLVGQLLGLNEEERNFVLDRVAPLPEVQKKPTKRASKKASSKSGIRCQAELVSGATCNMTASHGIHDPEQAANYVESHEFLAKKSKRAASLSGAIQRAGKGRIDDGDSGEKDSDPLSGLRCAREGCSWMEGDLIHDKNGGYAGYHPFESSKSVAPPAPPVPRRSSANGVAGSGIQNSGTDSEDVSNAVPVGG